MPRLICRLEADSPVADVVARGPGLAIDGVLIPVFIQKRGSLIPADAVEVLLKNNDMLLKFALELRIEADLTPLEELSAISKLAIYFSHASYLSLDGSPVLFLAGVDRLSHPLFSFQRIRQAIGALDQSSPPALFLSGAMDGFPLQEIQAAPMFLRGYLEDARGSIPCNRRDGLIDYRCFLYHSHYRRSEDVLVVPSVFALNEAEDGLFENAGPEAYLEWLNQSLAWIDIWSNGSPDAFILTESWMGHRRWWSPAASLPALRVNETPDAQGATADSIELDGDGSQSALGVMGQGSIAILIHAFHLDALEAILTHLAAEKSIRFDVYLSTPRSRMGSSLGLLRQFNIQNVRIFGVQNRGRDIAPFLQYLLPASSRDGHRFFVKIHTKRSPQLGASGQSWAQSLYHSLLGSGSLSTLHHFLENHPRVGIAAPAGSFLPTTVCLTWNSAHLLDLLRLTGIDGQWFLRQRFVAGSMFAGRVDALMPVLAFLRDLPPFEAEAGQTDGTLAHALERMMCVMASRAGFASEEVGALAAVSPPCFGFEQGRPQAGARAAFP